MIIGISGKNQNDNDTVGKIIQYLTSKQPLQVSIEEFITKDYWLSSSVNITFQIKKFTDKLKDIVCLLIGCTREQLEDETFKNTELGEEWNKFQFIEPGGNSKRFISIEEWNVLSKNQKEWWTLVKLTPRLLLELLDIEIRRNIHSNCWINSLFSDYKPYSKGKAHDCQDWSEVYTHKECKNCKKEYKGWKRQYLCKECIEDNTIQFYPLLIITDLEHLGELKAIKDRNGITIKVDKYKTCPECGVTGGHKMYVHKDKSLIEEHFFKTALDDVEFDYIIENKK